MTFPAITVFADRFERKNKMEKKKLYEKVRACDNICGTHMALNCPQTTEILGSLGFDFIWVDTEHTSAGYQDLYYHIKGAQAAGTPVIVRVPMHDRNFVKKVLEMGVDGIIFPMVDTPEEAARDMSYVMYPPEGIRGFGPLGAVRWGLDDLDEYIKTSNERLCRFIQIETITAVKNLPEIVKNPYIDGYIFGPCDLSGSIGELNQVFGEHNVALIKEAIAILKANHKCIGVSTGSDDPKILQFWHDLGINMISTGVDYAYMMKAAMANLKNIREIQK